MPDQRARSPDVTKLLCATDLLPSSEHAVERAGMLAEQLGAQLSLLHVVQPGTERVLEESLQIAIDQLRARARPPQWRCGPTPSVTVRTGNPARLVCDAIEKERADLLILGPQQRRDVLGGVSGTIVEKAVSARKCPLLVVQSSADVRYRKVMLALDLSNEAALAVRAAEALVLTPDTEATVMHVCAPPLRGMVPSPNAEIAARAVRQEAAEAIHELLRRESADYSRYDVLVEDGHPIPAILRAVETHRPQLLVMGTRAAGRMRRALLGSVASQLLKEITSCDMLVVPRDALTVSNVIRSRPARIPEVMTRNDRIVC
jgi:universal stress protein E